MGETEWWFRFQQSFVPSIAIMIIVWLGAIWWRERKALPPGPWGLPIVGYLPFFSKSAPHLQLEIMKKKYGPVFGMYLGSKYTLFLCDLESVKEAYKRIEFSSRPHGVFLLSPNFQNFVAMGGKVCQDRRRLIAKILRQLEVGTDKLRDIAQEHIFTALDCLEKKAASSEGGEVNLRGPLTSAASAIIFQVVCGKSFPPEHKVARTTEKFLRLLADYYAAISLELLFPSLQPVLDKIMPRNVETFKVFEEMENYFTTEIQPQELSTMESSNVLGIYLNELIKSGNLNTQSRGEANVDSLMLMFAGADTIRISMEWFLLCMAQHPLAQSRIYHEIFQLLGPGREPCNDDRQKLPFTEAAILESLRYRNLAPINVVHSTSEDVQFRGWDIPKDSVVLCNLWSIHNDPRIWAQPENYWPQHFLNADQTSVIIPEAFVPFSTGKRSCLGKQMSRTELFLFVVHFMKRFQILPPDGGVNMDGVIMLNNESLSPVIRLLKR